MKRIILQRIVIDVKIFTKVTMLVGDDFLPPQHESFSLTEQYDAMDTSEYYQSKQSVECPGQSIRCLR